jgi:hypothetical protein
MDLMMDLCLHPYLNPEYWSGLLSSTDFTGQKLRKCLNTIHIDVVSVWNMRDPSNVRQPRLAVLIYWLMAHLCSISRVKTSKRGCPGLSMT